MRIQRREGGLAEFVQVYGERNSCTTYLSRLVQGSLRHPGNLLGLAKGESTPRGTQMFGYKHSFLNFDKIAKGDQAKVLFLVIYRNPYTWIRSMLTRPYALRDCLEGKSVRDIAHIELVGRVNGKETTLESHPKTGKLLTLYQLRVEKIRSFEALGTAVDNVVFLNMEELLRHPSRTLELLSANFSSVFLPGSVPEAKPPRELMSEFRYPEPFDEIETAELNANLSWDIEHHIGYEQNNYFLKGESGD